jgi:hypothetical protein
MDSDVMRMTRPDGAVKFPNAVDSELSLRVATKNTINTNNYRHTVYCPYGSHRNSQERLARLFENRD